MEPNVLAVGAADVDGTSMTGVDRVAITPDAVLDAAMAIIESEGVEALSMRRLAGDLGVRTPTVYWHVGGRQDILDKIIERLTDEFGRLRPRGKTPAARISSLCMALVAEVRRRPHVIAVSRTAGRGEAIFARAQERIAREVDGAGLHGLEAAFALRTILFQLGGFIVVDFGTDHDSSVHGAARWEGGDPELRDELSHSIDIDEVFRFCLDAILARLLPVG
jgi:TetR/AcrR family transcriptional regulator, tetracycline repressor protein